MITKIEFESGFSTMRECRRTFFGAVTGLVLTLGCSAQNVPLSGPTTIKDSGRGLPEIVARVQQIFSIPITFEEIPWEGDVRYVTVIQNGVSKTVPSGPKTSFSFTLMPADVNAYSAIQSLMAAYTNAQFPGGYAVLQNPDRIDIVPAKVLGVNAQMRDVRPIMNSLVTIPVATRSIADTVQAIADAVTANSGVNVVVLNVPDPFVSVTLGASNESARDAINEIGKKINYPISFQCLYDVISKSYYLNVVGVPERTAVTNGTASQAPIDTTATQNPWFSKGKK